MTTPTGPGGGSLGQATGTIVIRFDDGGINSATNALNQVGNAANSQSHKVQTAAKGMAAAGAVIAGGFLLAIKSAAEFEKQLSAVQAVSNASAGEMDQVRQKALQLGKDTKFSAAEGAQAIEELVKAGISVADVMGGAADATVALAAAGEVDLPTAATIAANAMNQFKLSAEALPHVADQLAGAANASAIDVTDLGESLNYVGPVARAVGVSIEDASTAIAILGNNGIKGSSAGTALRSVLSNLTPTTKKATAEFKALGLITESGTNLFQDAATGGIKPLDEVVQILNDHTANLSKTEKNTFAKKAFGLETLAAVSVLAAETSDSFDTMAESIKKTTAADVAATRMDNLQGSIEQLKGSFETFMIVIGTPFLNSVRQVVDALNVVIGVFLALPDPVREIGSVLGVTGGALLLFGGTAIIAATKIKEFYGALKALAATNFIVGLKSRLTGLILLMGPAGPWVAAFTAATVVLGALFLMHRQGKRDVTDLTDALKADTGALGENTREAVANRLEKQGVLEDAQKLGVNLRLLTGAVLGEADSQDALTSSLRDQKAALQDQADALILRNAQANANDPIVARELENVDKQINAIDALSKAYGNNNKDMTEARARYERMKDAALAVTAASDDQTAAIKDRLALALGRVQAESRAAAGVQGTLKNSLAEVKGEAEATDKAISEMNKTIKALFDAAYASDRALEKFHSSLNGLKQQVKENGTSLSGFNDKAVANKEALRGASEEIGNYASALLENGTAPEDVARKVGELRRQLINQADAAGFSRDKVKSLIGVLDEVQDSIEVQFNVNADPAIEKAREVKTVIENIPSNKTVNINVVGGIGALEHAAMATGGIVTKPTLALIGEGRSSEAVIPLPDLAESFLRIFNAGRTSTMTNPAMSGAASVTPRQTNSSGSRIVSGTLGIDPSGRAWISGVAQDVYDGEDQFATTYGRMG